MRSIRAGIQASKTYNDDPVFTELVLKADSKGLRLRKNAFGMGFALTLPNNESKPFKSFSALSTYIDNYQGSYVPHQ